MASGLLARSDFPLYTVKSLDERHFLVAGGGGAAKTGVSNAIEIYELKLLEDKVLASSICRHDTGIQAIMNGCNVYDGRNHIFAAGLDDECHIFSLKYRVVSPEKGRKDADQNTNLRKRKEDGKSTDESSTTTDTKQILFDIDEITHVKTDFHKDGSFQKVVQFSPDHKILATGGADGFLRVWKYPDMEKVHEIGAHKTDIDDIDISPAGDKIVTVSRDNCGYVWKVQDGSKLTDLNGPDDYRFRACRYGLVEGKKEKFNLYTISIPLKRSQKPQQCYLTMWDSEKFKPKGNQQTGTEVLSSLATRRVQNLFGRVDFKVSLWRQGKQNGLLIVKQQTDTEVLSSLATSDDGTYVAVGTISGSVAVYISFSLQKLYYVKEAHSIFVTGLAFMKNSEAAKAVTGDQDFTLLSISADNTIRLHQVAPRGSFNVAFVFFGFLLIIFLLFWLISEFGL